MSKIETAVVEKEMMRRLSNLSDINHAISSHGIDALNNVAKKIIEQMVKAKILDVQFRQQRQAIEELKTLPPLEKVKGNPGTLADYKVRRNGITKKYGFIQFDDDGVVLSPDHEKRIRDEAENDIYLEFIYSEKFIPSEHFDNGLRYYANLVKCFSQDKLDEYGFTRELFEENKDKDMLCQAIVLGSVIQQLEGDYYIKMYHELAGDHQGMNAIDGAMQERILDEAFPISKNNVKPGNSKEYDKSIDLFMKKVNEVHLLKKVDKVKQIINTAEVGGEIKQNAHKMLRAILSPHKFSFNKKFELVDAMKEYFQSPSQNNISSLKRVRDNLKDAMSKPSTTGLYSRSSSGTDSESVDSGLDSTPSSPKTPTSK